MHILPLRRKGWFPFPTPSLEEAGVRQSLLCECPRHGLARAQQLLGVAADLLLLEVKDSGTWEGSRMGIYSYCRSGTVTHICRQVVSLVKQSHEIGMEKALGPERMK
jgi:hypothetical protein